MLLFCFHRVTILHLPPMEVLSRVNYNLLLYLLFALLLLCTHCSPGVAPSSNRSASFVICQYISNFFHYRCYILISLNHRSIFPPRLLPYHFLPQISLLHLDVLLSVSLHLVSCPSILHSQSMLQDIDYFLSQICNNYNRYLLGYSLP